MDFASYQNLIEQSKHKTEDNVSARFYDRAVKTSQTDGQGMPVFKTVCYCEIRIKDNTTEIYDQPATEEKCRRFPAEYARYQLAKKQVENGTPLEQFAFLTVAEIETCKCRGILTIEHLAALDGRHAMEIGLSDEAAKAKRFVDGNAMIKQGIDIAGLEREYSEKLSFLEAENAKLKQKLKWRRKQ